MSRAESGLEGFREIVAVVGGVEEIILVLDIHATVVPGVRQRCVAAAM